MLRDPVSNELEALGTGVGNGVLNFISSENGLANKNSYEAHICSHIKPGTQDKEINSKVLYLKSIYPAIHS